MERQPTTDRMIQEYVPGKQVTLAHLIANPGKDLFKKLGLQDAVSAIGILTITQPERVIRRIAASHGNNAFTMILCAHTIRT